MTTALTRPVSALHDYQRRAVKHILAHDRAMLWLDMGLGKTASALTAISHLLDCFECRGALVIAPLRVVQTVWKQEGAVWEHMQHLTFSIIHGDPQTRHRALRRHADVYLVNYANIQWLVEECQRVYLGEKRELPFDLLVFDEITQMKSARKREGSVRAAALRGLLPLFERRIGLTGTPLPNGYTDLFGQFLVLDDGQRLGTSFQTFKERWFQPKDRNGYRFEATPRGKQEIHTLVSDITIEMNKHDYLDLPPVMGGLEQPLIIKVPLSAKARKQYEQLEKNMFLELDSGSTVEVFSKAGAGNKCIAKDTEVLTYSGWKAIQDCTSSDKVWDGVEWVTIDGSHCNGYMPIVDCWGVKMTPDHKVLTSTGWAEAQEIVHGEPSNRFNRPKIRLPGSYQETWNYYRQTTTGYMALPMYLWQGSNSTRAKFKESIATLLKVLRLPSWDDGYSGEKYPWDDKPPCMERLVRDATTLSQPKRQKLAQLWGTGYSGLQAMAGQFSKFLGRYGGGLVTEFNFGSEKQFQRVHPEELPLGIYSGTKQQYPLQYLDTDSCRQDDPGSGFPPLWDKICNLESTLSSRGSRGISCAVYDLVNAGPRHRFLVRSKDNSLLLVHNCLQFANGAIYTGEAGTDVWEEVHTAKLDALEELYDEAGTPILCSYNFRHDAERIKKRFGDRVVHMNREVKRKEAEEIVWRWNNGEIPFMIGHAASIGHGLNLQYGCHTEAFFGLPWSLELYLQFYARVMERQGQTRPGVVHFLLTDDTADYVPLLALQAKRDDEVGLREAVKQYRRQKYG